MNCLSMLLLIYTVNTFYNHYAFSCFIAAFKQFMPYVMLVIGVITHNTEIWLIRMNLLTVCNKEINVPVHFPIVEILRL